MSIAAMVPKWSTLAVLQLKRLLVVYLWSCRDSLAYMAFWSGHIDTSIHLLGFQLDWVWDYQILRICYSVSIPRCIVGLEQEVGLFGNIRSQVMSICSLLYMYPQCGRSLESGLNNLLEITFLSPCDRCPT